MIHSRQGQHPGSKPCAFTDMMAKSSRRRQGTGEIRIGSSEKCVSKVKGAISVFGVAGVDGTTSQSAVEGYSPPEAHQVTGLAHSTAVINEAANTPNHAHVVGIPRQLHSQGETTDAFNIYSDNFTSYVVNFSCRVFALEYMCKDSYPRFSIHSPPHGS